MNEERLRNQLNFLIEIDKLKTIYRKTRLADNSRCETVAEHSWHFSLMVLLLHEYSPTELDLLRVLKMALIHDLVEIYSGDTYAFIHHNAQQVKENEKKAAIDIFNILPQDQCSELLSLWNEFEEQKTFDSIFANAMDRFQPFINDCYLAEKQDHSRDISQTQMIERMSLVKKASAELWTYIQKKIYDNYPDSIK